MLIGFASAISVRADLHVSPAGSDAAPGTRSKPFATLERARDAVRGLKREGKLPRRGITIWLRGGDYFRSQALELAAEDSGTPSAPNVRNFAYVDLTPSGALQPEQALGAAVGDGVDQRARVEGGAH